MDSSRKSDTIWFLGVVCLAVVVAYMVTFLLFRPQNFDSIMLGVTLGITFNLSGLLIRVWAVGKDVKKFFVCTFMIWPLNAVLFLGAIVFAIRKLGVNIFEFVSAIFIAYFLMMIYDIFKLRRLQLKTQ